MGKTSIHTVYKTTDGQRVPGVTTITGQLDKPALVHWAWKLGKKGIDYKKFRDDKADIGTLAHALCIGYLLKQEVDTSDYTAKQIDSAENCLLSFYEWEKGKEIEILFAEEPLVSNKYRYGGTPDIVALIDGILTMPDIKTGKAIYPEMIYQLSGYKHLAKECEDVDVEKAMILRIGRDETEGFEVELYSDKSMKIAFKIFLNMLEVYYLKKELKGV